MWIRWVLQIDHQLWASKYIKVELPSFVLLGPSYLKIEFLNTGNGCEDTVNRQFQSYPYGYFNKNNLSVTSRRLCIFGHLSLRLLCPNELAWTISSGSFINKLMAVSYSCRVYLSSTISSFGCCHSCFTSSVLIHQTAKIHLGPRGFSVNWTSVLSGSTQLL